MLDIGVGLADPTALYYSSKQGILTISAPMSYPRHKFAQVLAGK
jgi:hypothetical protein